MKRLLLIFFGAFLLILLMGSMVSAVSVQPMTIKITAKPGETVPFKIKITAKENSPEVVNFILAQPQQKLDGAFVFKPADSNSFPDIEWVKLNLSSITVANGEEKEVTGTIKVPSNARGYHLLVVMVEQPPIQKTGTFVLAVNYAVTVEINVDASLPRQTSEVTDFQLVKGDDGEPCIQFKAKNNSQLAYGTEASVLIRNSETKKLIERVTLKPKFYLKNNSDPFMIPGAILQFMGTPKEALLQGTYDLQLVFRYATSGQILMKKNIEVKPGDFTYSGEKLKKVLMDSSEIVFRGKPGTVTLKGVKFENRSNQRVKVMIRPMDLSMNYPYSILKNTLLEFPNGQEFTIDPGRVAVAIITVKLPNDAPVQGNYGQLIVTSFTDGNPNPIEESTIALEAITLGKPNLVAEATDLAMARDNNKLLLSTIVKNTGNFKITPKATLYIQDNKGKYIDSVQLTAQVDNCSVLPMKLMTLTGFTNENIAVGNYKAEIRISQDNQEIGKEVFDLQVK